ncbi:regulator of chromosome condensation [Phytophthora boehmeriae]|uniref:Regulator of chromosome condensation n=1 Tax=Phytophthora boehmeriae TaxID=109152 RepID=A0A8T1WU98_9STRA|nr:regulator of chromosome condensation [Phytophthora boehmeriae]
MEAETTPMEVDVDEDVPLAISTEASTMDPDVISLESVATEAAAESDATQTEAQRPEQDAWDDEDGWMPKPARLHSGKTRSCAVCFAPLQYTAATCWDEYLQSEEYLEQLQANVLQDAFVSALICGENTVGDLPTEHRMHKNRKLKCRQSVQDYRNMTSAGVVDTSGMEKGSIRTLEEMLIEALPTPVFTHVLERRLAVISHSSKIACELMRCDGKKKIPRPTETAPNNEELHHLAIHTLSALLGSFDYRNPQALRSFEELSQLLTCFPVLSLYSFWSPAKKPPNKPLVLEKDSCYATRNCGRWWHRCSDARNKLSVRGCELWDIFWEGFVEISPGYGYTG